VADTGVTKAIAELGECIDRDWFRYDYADEAFAPLAARVLIESNFLCEWPTSELNEWFLREPRLPDQAFRDFGQPALTIFQGYKFYIELLYWLDSTTAIHQHSFAGAFGVLSGSSLHSRYHFECQDRASSELVFGTLSLKSTELLGRGDVREIHPGDRLIHSTFHLERPTLTLVIRTQSIPRFQPQYSYRRSGLGYDPFFAPEPFTTRLRLLKSLRDVDDPAFWRLATDLLTVGGPWMTLSILNLAHSSSSCREWLDLISLVRKRHGERVDVFLAIFEERAREQNIIARRRDVRKPDHRFFLALLLNLSNRNAIFRMITERHPDCDAEQMTLRWVSELAAEHKIGLEFDPLSLKMLHYSLRNLSLFDFKRGLTSVFGASQVIEENDKLQRLWEELHESSLLQPLFVVEDEIGHEYRHA
jgi:hypothetical protein